MTTTTIEINAKQFEDCDDCLQAAAIAYAEDNGLPGWDLNPRWRDNAARDVILLDVPEWPSEEDHDDRTPTEIVQDIAALRISMWIPSLQVIV